MKKSIIIVLAIVVLLMVWYFFAPIRWTFGLRQPKNFQECVNMGNKMVFEQDQNNTFLGSWVCSYKDKQFKVELDPYSGKGN